MAQISRTFLIISIFFLAGSCLSEERNLHEDQQNYHVWIFLEVECPISQFYTSILNDYQTKFREDSVIFHAVFPHQQSKDPAIKEFIKLYQFKIRPVGDPNLSITKRLSATITPEVFITKGGTVLYQGLIDNTFIKLGESRKEANRFYLHDALTKLLSANDDFIQRTKAIGCIIEQ